MSGDVGGNPAVRAYTRSKTFRNTPHAAEGREPILLWRRIECSGRGWVQIARDERPDRVDARRPAGVSGLGTRRAYPLTLFDPQQAHAARLTEQHVDNGGSLSLDDRWLAYQALADSRPGL